MASWFWRLTVASGFDEHDRPLIVPAYIVSLNWNSPMNGRILGCECLTLGL